MPIGSVKLQGLVHSLGEGHLGKLVQGAFIILAAGGLALLYPILQFKGLDSSEPMELGHVARQVADGKGFTTLYIRPFSLDVLQRKGVDPRALVLRQPELTHPPLYIAMLSGVFKALRTHYDIDSGKLFTLFSPEIWMCAFAEFWLLLAAGVFYLTARRVSDPRTALISLFLMLLCNQLWRYAISGSPSTFLIFLFCLITYAVVRYEESRDRWSGFFWIGAAAVAIGAGFLAKYRFGLLILPLLTYILIFGGRRRGFHVMMALLLAGGIALPWMARNTKVCGLPLGLSTYAPLQYTDIFAGNALEREIKPNFGEFTYKQLRRKWMASARNFFETEFKTLGANYLIFFFVVGLLFAFKSAKLQRLRYFALFVWGWLLLLLPFIWNADAPVYSGNLFVLLIPLIFLFGTIFFFVLLDRYGLGSRILLLLVSGIFILLNSLPLVFTLLPPRPPPYRFPPYYPPMIYSVSKWMKPGELMMSDMPWAVAWYGNTSCMPLSKTIPQFLEINDYIKKISALYFTPLTMHRGMANEIIGGEFSTWAPILFRQVPENFPLRAPVPNLGKEFLFVTDRVRWQPGGG